MNCYSHNKKEMQILGRIFFFSTFSWLTNMFLKHIWLQDIPLCREWYTQKVWVSGFLLLAFCLLKDDEDKYGNIGKVSCLGIIQHLTTLNTFLRVTAFHHQGYLFNHRMFLLKRLCCFYLCHLKSQSFVTGKSFLQQPNLLSQLREESFREKNSIFRPTFLGFKTISPVIKIF